MGRPGSAKPVIPVKSLYRGSHPSRISTFSVAMREALPSVPEVRSGRGACDRYPCKPLRHPGGVAGSSSRHRQLLGFLRCSNCHLRRQLPLALRRGGPFRKGQASDFVYEALSCGIDRPGNEFRYRCADRRHTASGISACNPIYADSRPGRYIFDKQAVGFQAQLANRRGRRLTGGARNGDP
jgi:hypothetical protein